MYKRKLKQGDVVQYIGGENKYLGVSPNELGEVTDVYQSDITGEIVAEVEFKYGFTLVRVSDVIRKN